MHHGRECRLECWANKCLFRRIRGLVKAKALHEQVAGMEKIATQLKANKEQIYEQIHQLKQRIDQLIHQIAVTIFTSMFFQCLSFLEYSHDSSGYRKCIR